MSFAPAAFAQTGTVAGRVTDAETGAPLPGAAVLVAGTERGDATDADGEFTIRAVPVGEQTIEVSLLGYETAREAVTVGRGETARVEVALSESSIGLDRVVVEAESEAERIEATAQAVAVLDLREARVQAADLGLVLAQTQGVAVQRSGGLGSGARFSLNGLTDDQIRFFLDGLPLELAGYPFGIANVPVSLIGRVEVYKGVVPIHFGADALGGAVNLVTKDLVDVVQGSASYQTGSFGTHRTTGDLGFRSAESGLFVRGGGFYDFARNDYEVTVQVADELGRPSQVTVPRFNDRYRAGGANLTLGVADRPWADELSVRGYVTDFANQIQNNALMTGLPYGEAESLGTAVGANVTYRAKVADRGFVDAVGGYTSTARRLSDVSNCRYNWFGECFTEVGRPGEVIRNRGTDRTIWDDDALARLSVAWLLGDRHRVEATTAPTFNWRTGRDALITQGTDLLSGDARLTTWVSGLQYQYSVPSGRFESRLFVKDYRQLATSTLPDRQGFSQVRYRTTNSLAGIGNVTRMAWTDRLSTKASYEWATRLPRRDEFFGNGLNVSANPELLPERSHNANVEVKFSSARGARTPWALEANGFLRATENLIVLVPENEFFEAFTNVFNATSVGIEARGRTSLLDTRLALDVNTTYQSFRNTSREGLLASFRGDRIPNRPYYFANAAARYRADSPVRRGDEVAVFASTRYVHRFFRSWESAGRRDTKREIPSQTTIAAGITYESGVAQTRWALTGEVQNLTNATVFDFFGVQRPGRAFYLKLTTQL
ncbi:MAG: carboxypeptidase-like regulatory domain-containing protein [Bacteroidota bacterium]